MKDSKPSDSLLFIDRPNQEDLEFAEFDQRIIIIRVPAHGLTVQEAQNKAKAVLKDIGHPDGHRRVALFADNHKTREEFEAKIIKDTDEEFESNPIWNPPKGFTQDSLKRLFNES